MLFDERDMRIFQSSDARKYFKEILQSYYGQNYRATIVLLYSFVIYDLFMKLQVMANEGEKKAEKAIEKINKMIGDDKKYSEVEIEIINFFKDNCGYYFKDFESDITYLKDCRNKCAHLKVNDNSLYVPKDYQAKMMICSMYDNILSVKAPFISDLFSFAESDVEKFSSDLATCPDEDTKRRIKDNIKGKYLSKMTYGSLTKSYKTFIKFSFISEDNDVKANGKGINIFTEAMTEYIVETGNTQLFSEDSIVKIYQKISLNQIKDDAQRLEFLQELMISCGIVRDMIRKDEELFTYVAAKLIENPNGLKHYKDFYPDSKRTKYQFFQETENLQRVECISILFETLKDEVDFELAEFLKTMIKRIPTYNGFDLADCFMDFFKLKLSELSDEEINEVINIYETKNQCTKRARHSNDMEQVKEFQNQRSLLANAGQAELAN